MTPEDGKVQDDCHTLAHFMSGGTREIHDMMDRTDANMDLGKTWTGVTKFKVMTTPVPETRKGRAHQGRV